jgi:hypothetical protein
MLTLIAMSAGGWSLVYLLFGGSFTGALGIFVVLKLLGK